VPWIFPFLLSFFLSFCLPLLSFSLSFGTPSCTSVFLRLHRSSFLSFTHSLIPPFFLLSVVRARFLHASYGCKGGRRRSFRSTEPPSLPCSLPASDVNSTQRIERTNGLGVRKETLQPTNPVFLPSPNNHPSDPQIQNKTCFLLSLFFTLTHAHAHTPLLHFFPSIHQKTFLTHAGRTPGLLDTNTQTSKADRQTGGCTQTRGGLTDVSEEQTDGRQGDEQRHSRALPSFVFPARKEKKRTNSAP